MKSNRTSFPVSLIVLFLVGMGIVSCSQSSPDAVNDGFQPERAMADLKTQIEFGPRIPGTTPHQTTQAWITETLQTAYWSVIANSDATTSPPITNLIADNNIDTEHWVLLGAHYDTRRFSDQSAAQEDRELPVPGANDGASGVAILTELARSLPEDLNCRITLAFFDAEDQGDIDGRNWSEGAAFYASGLTDLPDEVIIIDMVGDKDLQIFRERNSSADLTDSLWRQAADLGFEDNFINRPKYSMIDDHMPFIKRNITTTLIIDFDYPAWHTPQDDLDQVSTRSLQVVGQTLYEWLINHPICAVENSD